MEKGFWLKLFLIVFIIAVIVAVTFAVDFNLIVRGANPKFCIKTIEHDQNATEYTGVLYKIIKYNLDDGSQKYKIGTWFLKYNENFLEQFKEKIDIQGYIKEVNNNSGICVVYIERNGLSTKKFKYDKAYVAVSKETVIKDLNTDETLKKSDLKVGQLVNVTFAGDVQEIYPVRGTAGSLKIVENVENGEDLNE